MTLHKVQVTGVQKPSVYQFSAKSWLSAVMLAPNSSLKIRGYLLQSMMLLSINVPIVSFGLALGWVSLASGDSDESSELVQGGVMQGGLVWAAALTFLAGLGGVPLGARALRSSRRAALAATSAAFAASWALTLGGGWWLLAARVFAGVAGAVAWCIAPLLGKEVVSTSAGGAAAAAPVLAHNFGMMIMYLAAHARLAHSTVVCACLALSVVHAGCSLLSPESPAFLAASGRQQEAERVLSRLLGLPRAHAALVGELAALPPPEPERHLLDRARELLQDRRHRRALLVTLSLVAGQEACGVLSVLQFAERWLQLAGGGRSAAALALALGGAQLLASAAALYAVERIGRRPLLVWCALATGVSLAAAACGAALGVGPGMVGGALAAAVAADSLGLQPAPYAILADMFHYQHRAVSAAAALCAAQLASAAETAVLPALASSAGLAPTLAVAASFTLLYAACAAHYVPETRGRTPEQIYDDMCPTKPDVETGSPHKHKKQTHDILQTHTEINSKQLDNKGFNSDRENKSNEDVKCMRTQSRDNRHHLGASVPTVSGTVTNAACDDLLQQCTHL